MATPTPGNRGPTLIAVCSVMMGLAFAAVLLRLCCRRWTRMPFEKDDWLVVAALPFAWTQAALVIWMVQAHHYGQHVTNLSPDDVTGFFRGLYSFQAIYPINIALIKFSFLAFYWRLFHVQSMKIPLFVTAALVAVWMVAIFVVAIFSCWPIHGFWELTLANRKCINTEQFYLAQSVYSIITDLMILILPMPIVWNLQISRGQKIGITSIFLVGTFLIVASVFRLSQLIKYLSALDFSWDLVNIGIWTVVEVHMGIVCACLGSMRPLIRFLLHGTFTAPTRPSNKRSQPSKASNIRPRPGSYSSQAGFTQLPDKDKATFQATVVALSSTSSHSTHNESMHREEENRKDTIEMQDIGHVA
ncbi:hypothetical protein MMC25_001361 [Agyrium rufum]|nr:hypothetical protein [Agyrium rufum]